MKTTTIYFRSALAAILLTLSSPNSYATFSYSISFAASGSASSVDNVEVRNLTKSTTVTVPSGNTLILSDAPTAINELNANVGGINISQNASIGTSTLTFYIDEAGSTQVAAYALDGRKVLEQTTRLEAGYNSVELSLPTGIYVIRVSGTGYVYSAKLQNQTKADIQAKIKFLTHTKTEATPLQRSKAGAPLTTTMTYTVGDQLLYIATSGSYKVSMPDMPTSGKTIIFNFASIVTSAIPAGTFWMGSPTSEPTRSSDEAQFQVTLSAFLMSKYEISNAQYAAFLNANSIGGSGIWPSSLLYPTKTLIYDISYFGLSYNGSKWVPETGFENAPVINVSWYGATEYATYVGATLPTEAQWEYACRAGTDTPFNTGSCLTNIDANYRWTAPYYTCTNTSGAFPNKPQSVGSYGSNAYDLYDMHGNVLEWCSDWYDIYPSVPQTNPTGAAKGSYRIFRGGSWNFIARDCRSAYRGNYYPETYSYNLGFRVVFVP